MRKVILFILFVLSIFLKVEKSYGQNLLQQSPDYLRTYQACVSSPETFKNNFYISVYQQSISHTIKLFTLSKDAIYSSLSSKGVTPSLDHFLSQDSTVSALTNCLGFENHMSFIKNSLAIDFVGKTIGISIGSLVYLGIGKISTVAFKILLKPIAAFSPIAAQRISQITAVTLTGLGLYNLKTGYDDDQNQASLNGKKYIQDVHQSIKNISVMAESLKDTAEDLQFDISVDAAEKLEHRKLSNQEIKMFCKAIPGAIHRCAN